MARNSGTCIKVPTLRLRDPRYVKDAELVTYKQLSLSKGSLYPDLLNIKTSAPALLEAHLLDLALDGVVVAWALAVWAPGTYYPTFKVYVKPSYRRRGYATLLYNKATEIFPDGEHALQTFPHSTPSLKFFLSVNQVPNTTRT